jgi:tetratricopeptide (TPR) repeat protein
VSAWQELLKDADAVEGGKARLLYALGLAYLNSEPSRREQALASWEEAFQLGGDEAQAAGLRLGELRLAGAKADVPAALAAWTKALANVRTVSDYQNQSLPLSRAQEFMENACRYFLDNKDYDTARQIADLYKKIAAPGVAEEHAAQAAEGLAREFTEQIKAQALSPADEAKLEEVRAQFHRAAVAYEEAAVARADAGQPEVYWRSAQCYLAARDFNRAGAVLSKFVVLQKNDVRIAEGLLAMAETYAALGEKDRAREAYYKCIEYRATPFACRARYQLALEEIDNKHYEQAQAILLQNLDLTGPIADRAAHEKSTFKIAELYTLLKDYDKAVLYYKDAIRQYPQNPGVPSAQDALGDSYKQLAELAKSRMMAAKDEQTRTHHANSRRQWLEWGAKVYDELSDTLEHKSKMNGSLMPIERGLLRKALFEAADLKLEANDFAEALRRYESLQDRYRRQVEGLFACHKIFDCTRVMIATANDRKTVFAAAAEAVKKAKIDLAEMPADAEGFHGGPAVYTKLDWQKRLTWIEDQLNLLTLQRPTVTP